MHRREVATAPAVGCPGDVADLYDRTVTDVYSYIASRVGDRALADDLTQDVFEAAARRAATGAVVEVAWLIGVARHKLVDHWRAQARASRTLVLAHAAEQNRRVEDSVAIDPAVAAVVLSSLNPTYRAALVLRHVDRLGVAAVAEHLGRTVKATEQILSRARAAFRDTYQGSSDE
jgi:RNA polymerase sigma-70 factor (ECF subfamily)